MDFPYNPFGGINGGYAPYQTPGLTSGLPIGLPLGPPPPSIPLTGALATTRLTFDEWQTIAGAATSQQQAVQLPALTQQSIQPIAQSADEMRTGVNAGRPEVKMELRSNGPQYEPFDRNRPGPAHQAATTPTTTTIITASTTDKQQLRETRDKVPTGERARTQLGVIVEEATEDAVVADTTEDVMAADTEGVGTANPRSDQEENNDNEGNFLYDDVEGPNQERGPAGRSHREGRKRREYQLDTDEEYDSSEEYEKTLPSLLDQQSFLLNNPLYQLLVVATSVIVFCNRVNEFSVGCGTLQYTLPIKFERASSS